MMKPTSIPDYVLEYHGTRVLEYTTIESRVEVYGCRKENNKSDSRTSFCIGLYKAYRSCASIILALQKFLASVTTETTDDAGTMILMHAVCCMQRSSKEDIAAAEDEAAFNLSIHGTPFANPLDQ